MRRIVALTAVVLCALAADASAQAVQRPARPYRGVFGGGPPPDPNRSRQEVTLNGSFTAGHDTWLSPGGSGGTPVPGQERHSGMALTGDAALSYFRGRTLRSISIDGRARSNGYSGINADPTIGGTFAASGETNLGRVTQLRVSQDFSYEPTLVLGVQGFSGVDVDVPAAPAADVSSGYLAQHSWTSNSLLSLDRRWTARHTTRVGAAYSRVNYLDAVGNDTSTRMANMAHSWSFTRTSSIRALYSFVDSELESVAGFSTPVTNQNIGLTFGYNRRLSPTRQLQITAGGGAAHVNTLNALDRSDLSYWMPSANGSVSVDVGRSWSMAGQYDRSVDVLQGVSLTSFATDSASASLSGLLNSRIETSLSASYSNGQSGGAGTTGRFENYSGSLRALFAISRCCATTVTYDYYVYRFENVVDLPTGFPPTFDRHAIRVGFTIRLPLYGTYVDTGNSPSSGRN